MGEVVGAAPDIIEKLKFYNKISDLYQDLYKASVGIQSIHDGLFLACQSIEIENDASFINTVNKNIDSAYKLTNLYLQQIADLYNESKIKGINIDNDITNMHQIIQTNNNALDYFTKASKNLSQYAISKSKSDYDAFIMNDSDGGNDFANRAISLCDTCYRNSSDHIQSFQQ